MLYAFLLQRMQQHAVQHRTHTPVANLIRGKRQPLRTQTHWLKFIIIIWSVHYAIVYTAAAASSAAASIQCTHVYATMDVGVGAIRRIWFMIIIVSSRSI